MPASITIGDVPESVRDELNARARQVGLSLQEYLRSELIDLVDKPDVDSLLERAADRKDKNGSSLGVEKPISHRDSDRR